MKIRWRILLTLLVLSACVFVVYNGSQHACASYARSEKIVYFIRKIFGPCAQLDLSAIVRKGAHIIEYGMFSFVCLSCLRFWGVRRKVALLCTIIFGVILGSADELVQGTIDRSPSAFDALFFDQIGTLLGIGLLLTAELIINKIRNNCSEPT